MYIKQFLYFPSIIHIMVYWTKISRLDTPICSIHQPRNPLSYALFWRFVIWWGPRINSALFPRWQLWATLVICINPSGKLTFWPMTLEWCKIRIVMGFQVCWIHFWYWIFSFRSRLCPNEDGRLTPYLKMELLNYFS